MHGYVNIFAFMIVAKQGKRGNVITQTKSESKIKSEIITETKKVLEKQRQS